MSNVKSKYLKDENGDVFSPITSVESIYKNDQNVENYFDGRFVAMTTYTISNNSTANLWYKLGTLQLNSQSDFALFRIKCGPGQNGNSDQNIIIELAVKRGWFSSTSPVPKWAGGSFNIHKMVGQNNIDNIKVKMLSSSIGLVDIWLYFPWFYAAGNYNIEGKFASFSASYESQSSEPSYGTVQNCDGGFLNTSKELFAGTATFGNNVLTVPANITKLDVYVLMIVDNGQNRVVVSVPARTPSVAFTTGQLCALAGTKWIELELTYNTGRVLKADYCGLYSTLTESPTNMTNNTNFCVYRVVGYF